MSEQYRCSECGNFVEILDDAICDVCNIGKMEHLRYIKGGDGSHWEGCEEVHWDCKIAKLEAELARRDEKYTELYSNYTDALVEIECKDEIIRRLKEDGERLARNCTTNNGGYMACIHCLTGMGMHTDTCPIALHRALMKELE